MSTDYEQAQAVVNAMYDACKLALETPDNLMQPRDYFEKLLGDTAQSYTIRGYEEITAERDRYRDALVSIRHYVDTERLSQVDRIIAKIDMALDEAHTTTVGAS